MALVYEPVAAKNWANKVVECLNGGPESVKGCSLKFNEQIEKLVQPNVWTGAAAAQNFQNFMDTHNALIRFSNEFGQSFSQAMTDVAKSIADLEIANLGADTTVTSNFGQLNFSQITEMSEANINKEVVTYDYGVISEIGTALSSIKGNLEGVKNTLDSELAKLNSGSGIWDGNAAETAKETLTNVLNTNMSQIFEALNTCISNISAAAEAAQMADQG